MTTTAHPTNATTSTATISTSPRLTNRDGWPLVRFRPGIWAELEDMPRGELARELDVSTSTLASYTSGTTMPGRWNTIARLAGLLGRPMPTLLEDSNGVALQDGGCPAWCTDHECVTVRDGSHPGFVAVYRSEHVGQVTVTTRVRVHADGRGRVYVDRLDADALRDLTATLAERPSEQDKGVYG